jgi:hypothetical protein
VLVLGAAFTFAVNSMLGGTVGKAPVRETHPSATASGNEPATAKPAAAPAHARHRKAAHKRRRAHKSKAAPATSAAGAPASSAPQSTVAPQATTPAPSPTPSPSQPTSRPAPKQSPTPAPKKKSGGSGTFYNTG